MPVMTTGAAAAAKIADEQKKARSGKYFVSQLRIKDGDKVFLRFITEHDQWITADTHQFIPTKPAPAGHIGNWPETMWAVCQRDVMFRLRDAAGKPTDVFEDGYGDCYIHNAFAGKKDRWDKDMSRPAIQTYGLAVVREPVFDPASDGDPDAPVIGFKDKTVEFKDPGGGVTMVPEIVILSQKYEYFWAAVKAAAFMVPKTVLNKDFLVSRTDNDYTVQVINTTDEHMPGQPSWEIYGQTLGLLGFSLEDYILRHASPDHYARLFDPDATPASKEDAAEATAEETPAAASASAATVDQEALAGFRKSLGSRGAKK